MSNTQDQPSSPHATATATATATLLPPLASTESPSRPPSAPQDDLPPRRFDPSRTIGIIKRKALIKDLAAVYHAECLAYCQELLELQRKCEELFYGLIISDMRVCQEILELQINFEEPYADTKVAADSRKETMRPPKRLKKSR